MRRVRHTLVTVPVALALLAACGSSADTTTSLPSDNRTESGTVEVFAAASLKESFTTLGRQFEAAHPGVRVVLTFGPSSGLAAQITSGAPADVFASASPTNMDQVVQAGGASRPTTFAKNVMQIAVPAANPAGVTGLSSLTRAGVKVALCQPAVPCGSTAATVFANAGISVTAVSQELDVKGVITKVILGEVDAGVVYVTDVQAAGEKVKGITIPPDVNASTSYPVAVLNKAANAPAARAFTDYLLSPAGASVLTAAGFARP